ncbi:MAG: DUF4330 domain-containing protein [Tissierellaceae bacterium]
MNWIKKIGIIDIAIVVIVLGAVFYLVKPFRSRADVIKNTTPIVYTFETKDVQMEFINQLEDGIDVYDSNKNYYLGKIKDFRYEPYKEKFEDRERGIISMVEYPNLYTVLIDIEANAQIENDVILVDREEIRAGLYLPIKGKGFASYGYIVGIER